METVAIWLSRTRATAVVAAAPKVVLVVALPPNNPIQAAPIPTLTAMMAYLITQVTRTRVSRATEEVIFEIRSKSSGCYAARPVRRYRTGVPSLPRARYDTIYIETITYTLDDST